MPSDQMRKLKEMCYEAFPEVRKFCDGFEHNRTVIEDLARTLKYTFLEHHEKKPTKNWRGKFKDKCTRCKIVWVHPDRWAVGVRHCSICLEIIASEERRRERPVCATPGCTTRLAFNKGKIVHEVCSYCRIKNGTIKARPQLRIAG
jgi:hypothetical protein